MVGKRICVLCISSPENATFFSFPKDNKEKEEWIKFCGLHDVSANALLCSAHFNPDVLNSKRLSRYALPTIPPTPDNNCVLKEPSRGNKNRKCCLCGNSEYDDFYFSFPTNTEQREAWIQFCGFDSTFKYSNRKLCSRHFTPDAVLKKNARHYLKMGALPTLKFTIHGGTLVENEDVMETSDVDSLNNRAFAAVQNDITSTSNIEYLDFINIQNDVTCVPNVESPDIIASVGLQNNEIDTSHIQFIDDSPSINVQNSAIINGVTPPVKRRYAGDIKTPDFKTPRRAQRNLFLLKTEINKKASRIKVLKQKERRWKEKITTLKKLVEHLQDNNLISDQAKETLIRAMHFRSN